MLNSPTIKTIDIYMVLCKSFGIWKIIKQPYFKTMFLKMCFRCFCSVTPQPSEKNVLGIAFGAAKVGLEGIGLREEWGEFFVFGKDFTGKSLYNRGPYYQQGLLFGLVLYGAMYLTGVMMNYQPKQCIVIRENCHRFVLFDSTKMGNLLTPVLLGDRFRSTHLLVCHSFFLLGDFFPKIMFSWGINWTWLAFNEPGRELDVHGKEIKTFHPNWMKNIFFVGRRWEELAYYRQTCFLWGPIQRICVNVQSQKKQYCFR